MAKMFDLDCKELYQMIPEKDLFRKDQDDELVEKKNNNKSKLKRLPISPQPIQHQLEPAAAH